MTPQQVNKIIDYFADKTLNLGCLMSNNHQEVSNPYKVKTLIRKDSTHYHCIEHDGKRSRFPHQALTVLGHPVYIGNVLKKMKSQTKYFGDYMVGIDGTFFYRKDGEGKYLEVAKWPDTSESLQEIAQKSGYGQGPEYNIQFDAIIGDGVERLKDTKARDLFTYLAQFIND